jgi:Fe-S-cluster containining protein
MGEGKRRKAAIEAGVVSDADAHLLMRDIPLTLPDNLAAGPREEEMLVGAFRLAGICRRDAAARLKREAAEDLTARVMSMIGIVRGLFHHRTDQANETLMKGERVGCAAGCGTCCHQAVDVTIPEAILLALEIGRDGDPRKPIARARADEFAARTDSERFKKPIRCPLLGEDGNCSVYESRPIVCRGYYSDSRAKCEEAFRAIVAGLPDSGIQSFVLPQLFARAHVAALQGVCKDAGLQWQLVNLIEAVGQIVADPSVVERWANGEAVFRTLPEA